MPEKPSWHTATDPAALVKLLDTLKLLNGQGGPTTLDSTAGASAPGATEPTPTPEPAAAPTQAQLESTGFFTGWRWTIPGFLLGAVAAVLAVRLLPKRRWELVDTE
jgi:hypothetical protein